MTAPRPQGFLRHLHRSDLRAAAQLATQATLGVADLVEGVHQSVWSTLGFPNRQQPGRARGLTGWVYRGIEGTTRFVGQGVARALAALESGIAAAEDVSPETPQRQAFLAALNGVMGDRLVATASPLATAMTLRYRGEALAGEATPPAAATGKVLLLVHGLCMNDVQWSPERSGPAEPSADPWEALASGLGYTPVSLRYNSGLHTSINGGELSLRLESLAEQWPVPLEEITLVTHSMGGLVARSAIHQGQREGMRWPRLLKNVVFLGTPHHGALLERIGHWVDLVLSSVPYSAPFAKLVRVRSAGITDLRFGNLLEEDWRDRAPFEGGIDGRVVVPWPEGVRGYAVAATTTADGADAAPRGDGLVSVDSALGRHADPRRTLALPENGRWIAHGMNHLELLTHPQVLRQVRQWLAAP